MIALFVVLLAGACLAGAGLAGILPLVRRPYVHPDSLPPLTRPLPVTERPQPPSERLVMPRPIGGRVYIAKRVAYLYQLADAPARQLCLAAGWPE